MSYLDRNGDFDRELNHLIANTFDGAVENEYKLEDMEYQELRKHFIEELKKYLDR